MIRFETKPSAIRLDRKDCEANRGLGPLQVGFVFARSTRLTRRRRARRFLPATHDGSGVMMRKRNSRRRTGSSAKYAPMIALRMAGPLPADATAHLLAGMPTHMRRHAFAVANPTPPGRPANHQRNFQPSAR